MATFTLRFLPRDVVVTSIFARRDGRRSRSMRARNGRTVLLNLSPNRRRISPVTRSIEISSSPRAAQSAATVSAAGYSASRSAILKPYSDSLSATHFASTDSAPTLLCAARAVKSSWSIDGSLTLNQRRPSAQDVGGAVELRRRTADTVVRRAVPVAE